MSAWTTITAADLADYSVGAKITALRTQALNEGQTDPFERVMPAIVEQVRASIANAGNELSGTEHTIPPEGKKHVVWLIIEALQLRLGIGLRLTEDERIAITDAKDWLAKVAEGKLTVSRPDDPVTAEVQSASSISVVSTSTRKFTRATLDGF